MKLFRYQSGREIRTRDRVTYHGETGEVDFVVIEKTGDPALDWYIEQHPGGGVMLQVSNFGNVFLTDTDAQEDLLLVRREDESKGVAIRLQTFTSRSKLAEWPAPLFPHKADYDLQRKEGESVCRRAGCPILSRILRKGWASPNHWQIRLLAFHILRSTNFAVRARLSPLIDGFGRIRIPPSPSFVGDENVWIGSGIGSSVVVT